MVKPTRFQKFKKKYSKEIRAYSLLALPFLWWFVFFVVAFALAVYISFTNMRNTLPSISRFTLDNYLRILNPGHKQFDAVFWKSLGVSAQWTFFTTLGTNFFALFFGFLLSKINKHKRLCLALLYWPALVGVVVGTEVKRMFFRSAAHGIVNSILLKLNLISSPVDWFNTSGIALYALMSHTVFLGFSARLLICYASISGVPETYYDAAKLETDKSLVVYFRITIPLISNAILVNIVMSLIGGLKVIAPMQLLTGGMPNKETLSTVLYIYQLAIENNAMGRGSAYAIVLFLFILILTIVQMLLKKRKGGDSYE